jgi:hypothetical protein
MSVSPAWTLDEIKAYAERHGLTTMQPEHLVRLVELANTVSATGTAIPRMAKKSDEPASTLRVPLLKP